MTDAVARIAALGRAGFVEMLGGVYEHSPWVAERAFAASPFADEAALAAALRAAVDHASEAERLALIRAHPELASEKLRRRSLTQASMSEQASAGLDRLSEVELADWADLNRRYRERFGFPFVICVRLHTQAQVLAAMRRRLEAAPEIEAAEAVRQIHDIARLRLTDLVATFRA